ncbi:PAS domain S-box-containing protein [Bradyrhizobium sp. R2.2-H]|jgi:PAS domain S-box-containing protein|uniref:AAA family ATPase n=1 Tax=unclassified Bradyrhizobium TaxID=2631580 RepID=UPI00104FB989|nr:MULTISPECIES: AAA family ATPase [unclassified Bradyrhizobium]TCU64033.1 PAS domain S-box-containing protein [Bradyrhizobium sp. Y-H1]TCU65877.1 PAS domain S-box-containing protein [Bradyrhizobium sp. R2.2-H]
MMQQSLNVAYPDGSSEVLWEDGERVFSRGWRLDDNGNRLAVLLVAPAAGHPSRSRLNRLTHEYELKDELDGAWAARPLALMRDAGRTILVLDDPGGEPLDRLLGGPMEVGRFLRLAIAVTSALGKVHQRGLIHKDIKPANIVVDCADGHVRLTGFGIASRLSRERQAPEPAEAIAGTLAYMAPEQTGRMNRSVDARSDLYSLGVTLYQMLTAVLPFTAADPMEWVHCHIARPPTPPGERLENLPGSVSAIIMKLLAKSAEERYQTAAGAESDLRRCLVEWETRGDIDEFPPGEHDTPDQLLIPEKLYGRTTEIDTLLASFDRIVARGRPELVLVSGYAGIGKSAVVNELHKRLVPHRGLFASGKFDQYKRDIPYATLAQAFQSLIRPLLSKTEAELRQWQEALLEALEPNGRLIVDLVPELKHIIGERPPVPELPPRDAQGRFQLVFRRFISVFARPEHPLVLFLDDLQWLDAATLDLLEDLLTRPDVQNLLLIGAYRDNEVDPIHPLTRKLEAMRLAGATLQDIILSPLTCESLGQLVADTVHGEPERSAPLAQLIHEKTTGNPLFAIQFISALADEALLTFDYGEGRWCWDLNRIHAKGYTDNVVDLMVGKLNRLSAATRNALQKLACLGNVAGFSMLRIVYQGSEEEMHGQLWEAVRAGLIFRSEDCYKFLHDHVQEAAYSLIPEESRAEAHLRIGMLLAAKTPPEKLEEAIFEIVNQLNRGSHLITSIEELERVVELNLVAGRRAKTSTAYAAALNYLLSGAALLPADSWDRRHDLIFELEIHRAECEFLIGALAEAEQRLAVVSSRAATTIERARVTCLQLDLYTTLDQGSRAIAVGLDYLRHLGIDWSPHPTEDEARREYERIWSQLGSRTIESLIDLPLMGNVASLATLDVLTKLGPPAHYTDAKLRSMVICRAVNLSLESGNCDGSCYAYAVLGRLAGPEFGDYQAGLRFGRLGYELVEQRGLKRFQARTYLNFGYLLIFWTSQVREGRDLLRRAFETANQIGDLTFAAYYHTHINTYLLAAGDPLDNVQVEVEHGLAFARDIQFGFASDSIAGQLGLIRTLRGLTPIFGCFDDEDLLESRFCRNPDLKLAAGSYWTRKLQARFFAGDYAGALEASLRAQQLQPTSASFFECAEYHFYSALSRAASCESAAAGRWREHLTALVAHHRQLEVWATACPDNFENRTVLIAAEIARIEGRTLDAEHLYEHAIHSAHTHGFVHNEAIANEVAARFYATRGFKKIAHAYLRDARCAYIRWGADGKVRQLDELYPHLSEETPGAGPTSTIGASVEQLDLATVVKVSQAVSGEIVLEKLVDALMRTAIEHAGAGRGLLILAVDDGYRIEAEVTTSNNMVTVGQRRASVTAADLPESILNYVIRTKESILLHDAAAANPFSVDKYIHRHHPRSILCLPLLKPGRLAGVLYLENNLAAHVFTPDRVTVLKVLASQAAISLENSRLYDDLADREAKIRRLVDANIIGILIADREGRIIEANDAFLRIVGYDREDLVWGQLHRTGLTPPEWREIDKRAWEELNSTGRLQPFEQDYVRKDGSRVPVLIGAALFKEGGDQGLAFVLDLTERKRVEEALSQAQRLSRTGNWIYNATMMRYLYWSDESYRIWGFDPLQGLPSRQGMWERIHPEDRDRVWRAVQEAVDQKRDLMAEFRLLLPDGTIKWVEGTSYHVFSPGGTLAEVITTTVDVTERRRAQDEHEKLRQLELDFTHMNRVSMMGELAASLSHEILHPIATARNNARAGMRFLEMNPPNLDETKEALACVVRDTDRAKDIVGRMRAHIKKAPLRKERFDLNSAINEVILLAHSVIRRNGVSVQTRLADGLLPAMGDCVQLQQVLLNLILNAAEAMGSAEKGPRELLISAEEDQTGVLVAVRDSGPGINTEHLDRVFDAFYTTKSGGTGMGLSICRSIIEAHGGKLWAEANEPRGAAFQFNLPADNDS